MTATFTLTENETLAALALVTSCLNGMGGKRPSDLHSDPYTWVDAKDLMAAGWSAPEATGTFGALQEKGLVSAYSSKEWTLNMDAVDYLDTLWDTYQQGLASNIAPTAQEELPAVIDNTPAVTLDLSTLGYTYHANDRIAEDHANKTDQLLVREQMDLEIMSGPQLVAVFNTVKGPSVPEVKKFSSKEAAVKRVWAALVARGQAWVEARRAEEEERREPVVLEEPTGTVGGAQIIGDDAGETQPEPVVLEEPTTRMTETGKGIKVRKGTGINLAPKAKIYACRVGSKQAILVDMLFREQGATMAELLDALSGGTKPWKEVSVKSGLNWDMNKIKGYGIRTTKRGDEDCYHLVLPAGMEAPVPHAAPKTAAKGE